MILSYYDVSVERQEDKDMKEKELNRQARENLNRYFKEREDIKEEKVNDIVLDQQQLNQQINKEKEHYVSLELLRQQINDQAKEELKKIFNEKENEEVVKAKSKEEAYLDLLDYQYRQYKLVNELKDHH